MKHQPYQLPSRHIFLAILLPLLVTFTGQRLYLHFVGVHHVYPGGYLVHHLFFGIAMVLPAAFALAFGPRHKSTMLLALMILGSGSAMILDEIVYLVATQASDGDYLSALSLRGAFVFIAIGIGLLWSIYTLQGWCDRKNQQS
jgi:hypothetical protein